MSVFFGGLGLMSLHNPFAELVGMVSGKTDVRSMFCLVVFFIVTSILAYLTNPTENSFRAYLTEQSFRQHLSRLDENAEEDPNRQANSTSYPSARHRYTVDGPSHDNTSPFHFANRASIALRTPKHVFHSFGLFTIAAMVPLARSARPHERDCSIISDSWYIGAFGRWWRGGIIEAWYQDVIARSKDEESWSSGILSMKNLDRLNDYNGLPLSKKSFLPHMFPRGSPPKLRNRERSLQKAAVLPTRSLTPPPLPKSASLPLHTARLPSSGIDRSSCNSTQLASQNHVGGGTTEQVRLVSSPLVTRSPSTLFDHSPLIAEILRQISHSKAAVLELRTQISDCQSCAVESHNVLQRELDHLRERKRQEDTSKLETKSRTKTLDDSRRNAEGSKRDAEKKLKAAQNARDNATQRMDHLDGEIVKLQERLIDDEALIHRSEVCILDAKEEIALALEQKKREIKVAEDVVTALNQRARDLEERLVEERKRLSLMKENNEARKSDLSLSVNQVGMYQESWTPSSHMIAHDSSNGSETRERRISVGFDAIHDPDRRPSLLVDTLTQPDISAPGNQTLISSPAHVHSNGNAAQAALRANGYSVFDNSLVSAVPQHPYSHRPPAFSPFDDLDRSQTNGALVISPTSQSLIPSGLITSLDNSFVLPRSFKSESDVYLDREWRNDNGLPQQAQSRSSDRQDRTMTASPISPHSSPGIDHHSFDHVHLAMNEGDDIDRDYETPHFQTPENPMTMQRASWLNRTRSDPVSNYYAREAEPSTLTALEKGGPRRWFTTTYKEKPKKGLNPEAKVFSLARKTSPGNYAPSPSSNTPPSGNSMAVAFDALNPNGLGSTTVPASATVTSSFTRAFAPSPAEREALQRALGGSSNTSFERLPSLSDVGSMPSSPPHVDAIAATVPQHSFAKILPAWLQSLPARKANFSPWDDDESEGTTGGSGEARRR